MFSPPPHFFSKNDENLLIFSCPNSAIVIRLGSSPLSHEPIRTASSFSGQEVLSVLLDFRSRLHTCTKKTCVTPPRASFSSEGEPSSKRGRGNSGAKPSSLVGAAANAASLAVPGAWNCPACTLLNKKVHSLACEVRGTERPRSCVVASSLAATTATASSVSATITKSRKKRARNHRTKQQPHVSSNSTAQYQRKSAPEDVVNLLSDSEPQDAVPSPPTASSSSVTANSKSRKKRARETRALLRRSKAEQTSEGPRKTLLPSSSTLKSK